MTWFLILAIIAVAICLYFFPGIDPTLRKLLIGICVVLFIIWILVVLGLIGGGSTLAPVGPSPTIRVP